MAKALFSIAQSQARPLRVSPRPQAAAADMGFVLRAAHLAILVHPVFLAVNEPTRDGRAYPAVDGRRFARLALRLGRRGGAFPGPDVMFLREIDGTTYLHLTLVQALPDGMTEDTEALGLLAAPPRIEWNGGSFPLPEPTPAEAETPGTSTLRILAPLAPDQVAMLVQAMTDPNAGCQLVADYSASYRVRTTAPANPRPRPQRPFHVLDLPLLRRDMVIQPQVVLPDGPAIRPFLTNPVPAVEGGGDPLAAPTRIQLAEGALLTREAVIAPELLLRWRDLKIIDIPAIPPAPADPEERDVTATFSRRVPFFFDRTLDQNIGVFRAISGAAVLPSDWQDSEWGTLCPAEFVNTVYLLPHEFRLSYDAARGLPHMLPVQYAAPDGSRRLRVVLRTEPWFDPARVAGLQSALSRQSAGVFVHPQVIAGGTSGARLTLGTIFPEAIAVDGDAEAEGVAIDTASPFDLVLDLSEEYYALLVAILTGPIGLTGSVEITLAPARDGAPAMVRRIPLALSFQRLGALPLAEHVATATLNPERVDVTNRAAQAVTIAEAAASLLLVDENALLPAAVLAARPAEDLPLVLEAGGSATLTFAPVAAPEGAVWNAVVPVLSGVTAALDPDASLRAIHALAPAGSAGWRLRILSPQLAQANGPEAMIAVEVRMARAGMAPVQATLMAGEAERQVTFPRPLDDLIPDTAGGGGTAGDGFLRLSVTARGVWPSGFGPWTEPAEHMGDTLFVFVPARDGGGG